MKRTITETIDNWTTTTVFDGDLTSVYLYDAYFMIWGTGHARRNPLDIYDEAFGKNLASSRALNRFSKRLERHLIKQSNLFEGI